MMTEPSQPVKPEEVPEPHSGETPSESPADEMVEFDITDDHVSFEGRVWNVVTETVDLGHTSVTRDFVDHPGAVAILVLDVRGRVALLRQYRHPVRSYLWEIPAGLLDQPGESLVAAAQRELAEEADLVARTWHTLVDYYTSPGGSNEPIRIFLARDLQEVPQSERHTREDEEADMRLEWFTLSEAVNAVMNGGIHNPSSVVGLLSAAQAQQRNWSTLRSPDAPWLR